MCLNKVNRYAWYIGRGVNRDIVRRIIIDCKFTRTRFDVELRAVGYLGYPLNAEACGKHQSAFPG